MHQNKEVALEILKNEVDGDILAALEKMSSKYSMTWMYKSATGLFPHSGPDIKAELESVYPIRGRKYAIKHVAEGEEVVMIELIESYTDPKTSKLHQTPLVLVLEFEDGKIKKGRHYCDPQLSYENLSPENLKEAYKNSPTILEISSD